MIDYHKPVMVKEVVGLLVHERTKVIVDATVGGGGHAMALLQAMERGELIGIDRDSEALVAASVVLDRPGFVVRLISGRLSYIDRVLTEIGVDRVDGMLADLGVSSYQLDTPSRGFSFKETGPLDMRMDSTVGESAADLIRRLSEGELANLIHELGEERYSRRIARAIKKKLSIETTSALVEVICDAIPPQNRWSKIHPATRTFQALRIAVNDELGELSRFLEIAPYLLSAGGRLVVISYHSLEDRKVKRAFRSLEESEKFFLPFRKVILPSAEEIKNNPRSRSAKLRILERI